MYIGSQGLSTPYRSIQKGKIVQSLFFATLRMVADGLERTRRHRPKVVCFVVTKNGITVKACLA
jgi:hypothetical protein